MPLSEGQHWLLRATANGASWTGPVDVTAFAGPAFPRPDADVAVVASGPEVTVFEAIPGAPVAVWRSSGGGPWTQLGVLPDSNDGQAWHAAAGPRGWFVIGCGGACKQVTGWRSADALTWAPATNAPTDRLTSVVAVPEGFIAQGWFGTGGGCVGDTGDMDGVTWTSADGSAWRRMRPMRNGSTIAGLLPVGSSLVGLGLVTSRRSSVATSWTATIAPPPAIAPKPTPTPAPGGC